MKQMSVFHKGISTDLDYSKLDNMGMLLPTSNIRILNKEGQGLIVTPVRGTKALFELSDGFEMIGAGEYNGIAYIISHNSVTQEGEVGSFPSPNEVTGEFEEVYRPLLNLTNDHLLSGLKPIGSVMPLRSTEFNFDMQHPIGDQVVVLQDYDGSVSIIFTDNKNELRLVNSGFNQEGKALPERFYKTSTLEIAIRLIRNLPGRQKVDFLQELSGGNLKFGNYFFFYRYIDTSNNRTEFVAESQPVFITKNSSNDRNIRTTGLDEHSTKKITLRLTNVDNAFPFIEFVFVRFVSDGPGQSYPEVMLVDKFFSTQAASSTIDYEITGFETQVPIDISEILKPVNRENICKSILSYDRRMWGGNWKAEPINYSALSEYALNIKLGYDDSKEIPHWELISYYSDPNNIQYSGYFRGESYITGVVFVLNSGYRTPRFPVTGIDARNVPASSILAAYGNPNLVNRNGVITMPTNQTSSFLRDKLVDGVARPFGRILAITYEMQDANRWVADGGVNADWIKKNVSEIIFVRAERKENLLYQGVACNVYGQHVLKGTTTTSIYDNNGVSVPLFTNYSQNQRIDNAIPITQRSVISSITGRLSGRILFMDRWANTFRVSSGSITEIHCQSEEEKARRAIFSPDYILGEKEKVSDGDSETFIRVECLQSYTSFDDPSIRPAPLIMHFQGAAWDGSGLVFKANKITNVYDGSNWITPRNHKNNFVNKVGEELAAGDHSEVLFWEKNSAGNISLLNRSIITPPYIAFEMNLDRDQSGRSIPGAIGTRFEFPGRVVSVYRYNPNEIDPVALYSDELNLTFYSISHENYILSNASLANRAVCYRGDCFIQNVVIKTRSWEPTKEYGRVLGVAETEIGADMSAHGYGGTTEQNRIRYAHGQLLEIVTENKNNLALRVGIENETAYYPALRSKIDVDYNNQRWSIGKNEWAYFPFTTEVVGWDMKFGTGIESYLFNSANSSVLSLNGFLSNNPYIPKGRDYFPNRIRYTGKQETNFPVLAYRLWSYANKEDFEERFGSITKIAIVFGRLISVQENSIFVHHTNREETVPTSSGEMVIGVRSILSKEPSIISRFGSQHIFSIRHAKSGLYGWDWMNNTIWRVGGGGQASFAAVSLDKENLIENYLKELKVKAVGSDDETTTNIMKGIKDLMFLPGREQEGLITGYDVKNAEVLFASSFNGQHEVIRFSEDLNDFIGTFHFPVRFFFNIYNDLYSVENNIREGLQFKENVYIHGVGPFSFFYNDSYTPVLSFIVNGNLGGSANYVHIDKLFKAMEIEASSFPVPIQKIEFRTLYQQAENNPFIDPFAFWLEPKYNMSKWEFPINVANRADEQFYVNSNLIGKWLKVTIYFNATTDFYLKNVITSFISSQI